MPTDIGFLRTLRTAPRRIDTQENIRALLALRGDPHYISHWDDFLGDQLDPKYAATIGAGAEVVGVTAAIGGTATLTTAALANDSAGQGLGLHWNGDLGCYFIARAKFSTITGKFEIGFTDAADDDGAVLLKATPTFTATDCGLFVFDTTEDALVTFVSNGGTTDANADWAGTFAADTFYVFEVFVQGDVAYGYVNGALVGSGNIEGGNALTPWLYAKTLAAATRTLTVDYLGVIGPRS